MRIKIINPNTTASMTAKIRRAAERAASPGTEIIAVSPTMGPASIESHYDEALAAVGVLDEINRSHDHAIDAFVIACFGDPGLRAARELTRRPVIGIAEAATAVATMLAPSFSIVGMVRRSTALFEHLLASYQKIQHCRSIRMIDQPVLSLEEEGIETIAAVSNAARIAVELDGAEAILLGCAGLTSVADHVAEHLGVPVIDGVAAATRLAEAVVGLGYLTSKINSYGMPDPKAVSGLLSGFSLEDPSLLHSEEVHA